MSELSGIACSTSGRTPDGERAWDRSFDVVVVGAGPGGLAAALTAREHGASVAVFEANFDVGGRAILSSGGVYLGGGTSLQRAEGIVDSPEAVFTDWVRADHPLGRYNDRGLVWAYARNAAETFELLTEAGVQWKMRGALGRTDRLDTVPRRVWCEEWHDPAGIVVPGSAGSGIVRPLEKAARDKGVTFLLQHRMTHLHRGLSASGHTGPILGVTADVVDDHFQPSGMSLHVRAHRAVILATGGSSMNVAFRRMFDPRLTEEYQASGENWALANGDGEKAALAIGAGLWGLANQTNEADGQLSKGRLGVRSNYHRPTVGLGSPHMFRAKATGLMAKDYQNVILVRENGERFYDETTHYRDYGYFAAAMSWSGDMSKPNGGGPIWAIFDADAVSREGWAVESPHVDSDGYFFRADTIEELAAEIRMPHQWRPMPPESLRATVERYNDLVCQGVDEDFAKPTPMYKIQAPPFYAAWHTPCVHDTYAGLRINGDAQVLDVAEEVIPGLYATGDCAGGFAQHGIGRSLTFGRIAGRHACKHGSSLASRASKVAGPVSVKSHQ